MARQVGTIKWFGGFNSKEGKENDFGFIARRGMDDLYFHQSELLIEKIKIKKGDVVFFETRFRRGKEEATEIRKVWDEIQASMRASADLSGAKTTILSLLSISSREGHDKILENIPSALKEIPEIFALLPPFERFDILLSKYQSNQSQTIIDALVGLVSDYNNFINYLPRSLHSHPKIFMLLSAYEKLMILQGGYEKLPTHENLMKIYELVLENTYLLCGLQNR